MKIDFNKISQNKRYGYARVSSREQAENSSLESQKAELMKLGVLEENIYPQVREWYPNPFTKFTYNDMSTKNRRKSFLFSPTHCDLECSVSGST